MKNGWVVGLLALGVSCLSLGAPVLATERPQPDRSLKCSKLGIHCYGPQILFVLDPTDKFFGAQPCACEGAKLRACNPNATLSNGDNERGGRGGDACVNAGGTLTEVPTVIEAIKNPGSFVCTTRGGERRCFDIPLP